MKKSTFINLLVLTGVSFYNFLFWDEGLGLNVLIFTVGIIAALFYVKPEGLSSRSSRITIVGTLVAAGLVVFHNSWMSLAVFFISFTLMAGFIQHKELRHVWYAFTSALFSFVEVPLKFSKQFNLSGIKINRSYRWLRLSVFPMIILPIFFVIYYFANSHFANFSDRYFKSLFSFFQDFDPEHFIFLLSGLGIIGTVLWKSSIRFIALQDASKSETLKRFRRVRTDDDLDYFGKNKSTIGLKDEFHIGIMALVVLNALLFIVNILDFKYVWFDFQPINAAEMANFVHQGTYLLILSIMLAMGVLIYFFRRNLNFFPKNKKLKLLAYAWIFQNSILTISLLMRNIQYVDNFGLAYKRIGVFVFLCLVFYGLLTMYWKVQGKKSLYYLLHRNAWALYTALMITAFINWDVYITKYNINTPIKAENYDVSFLLDEISDKNFFVLKENKDKLIQRASLEQVNYALMHKAKRILNRKRRYSFLSWNYSDYRNLKAVGQTDIELPRYK